MVKKLDLIIELAGEDSLTKSRSEKALQIYAGGRLPIIAAGSHSGLVGPKLRNGVETEYEKISNYLISQGVNQEDLVMEKKSLDTFGTFYYLRAENFIPEGSEAGLITDRFHMPRSLFLARKVFGDYANFVPIVADEKVGFVDSFVEKIYGWMTYLDLRGIEDGDFNEIEYCIKNKHPYYSEKYWENQEFSWQGLIIKLLKKTNLKKMPFARSIKHTFDENESSSNVE